MNLTPESRTAPLPDTPRMEVPRGGLTALSGLMTRLGRLLLLQGITCDRMELLLERVAASQGVKSEINATPTSIFFTLGDGEGAITQIVRASPGSPDYHKLDGLLKVLDELERGKMDPAQAASTIDAITVWAPKHGKATRLLATVVLSACSALLLNLGWREVAFASVLGLAAGAADFKGSPEGAREAIPVLAAMVASLLAFSAQRLGYHVHPVPLLVAGLVTYLPGLQLAASMSELASGHWVAGSTRLVAGAARLLLLVLGGLTGEEMAATLFTVSHPMTVVLHPVAWSWLVTPLPAGLAFAAMRSGEAKDRGWVVAICYLAILAARLATPFLGSTGGAFAGAFVTVVVCNLLTRVTRRPALAIGAPAILLLVPGIMGLMSLSSVLVGDVSETARIVLQVLFISVSLALGGLLGGWLVEPRRLI